MNPTNFAQDVLRGLRAENKSLSSKYFYDSRGSELFAQITQLPEYYLTNLEVEILQTHLPELANGIPAQEVAVFELGPGDGVKSKLLLEGLAAHKQLCYGFIDIDAAAAQATFERLNQNFPGKIAKPFLGDFTHSLNALADFSALPKLVVFLGSNIGNFSSEETHRFLSRLRGAMRTGDLLLISFDLKKDPAVLQRAYDDSQGLTREFNLNLLDRMNRELGANFDRGDFFHHALYDPGLGAMESYLIARREVTVDFSVLDVSVGFDRFEAVHVESSLKYTPALVEQLARRSGFSVVRHLMDERQWFLDSLWRVA